jgi:hypothetical protein
MGIRAKICIQCRQRKRIGASKKRRKDSRGVSIDPETLVRRGTSAVFVNDMRPGPEAA